MFRGRGRLELIELFADKRQILHVEERDVEHVTDDDYSAACLYDLQHTHVHRSPTDRFDDRQYNVATIENWNRQHVQRSEERRVGKECRSRRKLYHYRKK